MGESFDLDDILFKVCRGRPGEVSPRSLEDPTPKETNDTACDMGWEMHQAGASLNSGGIPVCHINSTVFMSSAGASQTSNPWPSNKQQHLAAEDRREGEGTREEEGSL